jgi:hypothetical protein
VTLYELMFQGADVLRRVDAGHDAAGAAKVHELCDLFIDLRRAMDDRDFTHQDSVVAAIETCWQEIQGTPSWDAEPCLAGLHEAWQVTAAGLPQPPSLQEAGTSPEAEAPHAEAPAHPRAHGRRKR